MYNGQIFLSISYNSTIDAEIKLHEHILKQVHKYEFNWKPVIMNWEELQDWNEIASFCFEVNNFNFRLDRMGKTWEKPRWGYTFSSSDSK